MYMYDPTGELVQRQRERRHNQAVRVVIFATATVLLAGAVVYASFFSPMLAIGLLVTLCASTFVWVSRA